MFQRSDTHTVTEFSRKPAEHIKRLSKSRRPEILTVNGKAAVVIKMPQPMRRWPLWQTMPRVSRISGKLCQSRGGHWMNSPQNLKPNTVFLVEKIPYRYQANR